MTILPAVKGADRRGLGEIVGFCMAVFFLGIINIVQLIRGHYAPHNPETIMLMTVIGIAMARVTKGAEQRSTSVDAYNMATTFVRQELKQELMAHSLEMERVLGKYVGPQIAQQLIPMMQSMVNTEPSPHPMPVAVAAGSTVTTTTTATVPTTFEAPSMEKPAEPKP